MSKKIRWPGDIAMVTELIGLFDTQEEVASIAKTTQQMVSVWLKTGRVSPASVIALEQAAFEKGRLEFSRYRIRPDYFGDAPIEAAS